ncbi:serine threonine protein kinase [Leptolyngbya sp. Heron Island J]|uniref:serine/threonine protein kinase n=1 Tax=Leptolyngbya sp. Heron Island J TaxID=1385935 RepID=UPI0003B93A00|nr:serine/threonine-protein kinase [Leptolyngbya sp. Heron Island J]ESA32402.1 serine threonine protein kinase [Leptolyngbya sp. Heron Island J]
MTSLTGSSLTSGLPNFSRYGFRIESELGVNRAGGRVTYLATHLKTKQRVVIKQFQFAKSSDWAGYDALLQEGQVLKSLKHPGIPRYLGVFKSDDGFCMVQEYKRAKSLAEPRSFSPDAIRQIAISCLEILTYLQTRIPPIIHRDFKPANILVSDDLQVYLVDFGFARIGDGEVGMSSVVKGTLGFMPPEQIFNRQLTEASDLYGLGMTLICLLTNTPAHQVGKLVDVTYQVDFNQLKADLSCQWIAWLAKMVEPRLGERFANASVALENIPDHGLRQPQITLKQSTIELNANHRGELLTAAITLNNAVPETHLAGRWQVAPHSSDPNNTNHHSWIQFSPTDFHGNDITTQIQIDTGKLMAGQTYQRTLLLKSNAQQSVYALNLNVQTAPMPLLTPKGTAYPLLMVLLVACWSTVWIVSSLAPEYDASIPGVSNGLSVLAIFGTSLGLQIAGWLLHEARLKSPAARLITVIGAVGVALIAPLCLVLDITPTDGITTAIIVGLGAIGGSIVGATNGLTIDRFWQQGFQPKFAIGLSLLTGLLGTGLGLIKGLTISNPWMTFGVIANGIGIGTMLTYLPIRRAQAIALYRRNVERSLIRP